MRSAKWIGPGPCPVKSDQMHVDDFGMIVIDGPESTVERLLRHPEHWAAVDLRSVEETAEKLEAADPVEEAYKISNAEPAPVKKKRGKE